MKKRIFRLLPVLLVVLLFAMTVLAACNSHSEVYYLSKGSDFTAYDDEEAVPNGVRFTKGDNDIYTYVADFEQGEQFVVYNCGEEGSILKELFSSEQHLTLADGKVTVVDAGHYALSLDVGKGELSYTYTPPTPTHLTVESVAITTKVGTLKVGENSTFVATVTMSDNSTNSNVTWASSNTSVATVNASGKVEAIATGTATITATAGEISDSVQLTVTAADVTPVAVTALTLSGDDLEDGEIYLYAGGDPVTVNVAITPANATNKAYSYAVEDNEDGVVTVSAVTGGYSITPVKTGEVTLTVTSDENPQIKDQCTIIVDPVAVSDLQVSPATVGVESKFYVGGEQDVLVSVLPTNATDKTYSYQLSEQGIVEVSVIDGGYKVTASDVGTVTLTVTSTANGDVSATCEITVSELEVESIEMLSTLILEKGQSQKLETTLKPEGVVDTLAWTVSPQDIVSVDTDGTVHALTEGVATVTAHATNGVQADCVVTVPKHVTGISMSSGINVYTGDGARSRDLLVNFVPADATFTDFTVDVQQEGEIIEWVKGDGKITITGLAVGTATVTVTSVDNDEVSASCTVTVKDISEAVPYLSVNGTVSILMGNTSDEIEVLTDYGTISKIEFPNASDYVDPADKSGDGTFKFTITGKHIGGSSLTIRVTVGEATHDITLSFVVTAEYYLLVGTVGGSTNWNDVTEATARENNTLLTQGAKGWEITRHFSANDSFHLVSGFGYPAEGDNGSEMKADHETHGTMASYVGVARSADRDNVQIKYAGTYTILLTFGEPNAYTWQVLVEDIDVTTVTFESDNGSTLQPGGVESLKLTLTIKPDELKTTYSQQFIKASDIEWAIDDQHQDVLSIVIDEDHEGATITLNNFVGEEEDHATITCTVKGVVQAFEIALLPEGAEETPVTEIVFDDNAEVILVDVSGMSLNNWKHTISAHVNGDASVQGVVFSLLLNANVNGVSSENAFSINDDGVITAKMFGTVTIVATSVGNGEGGAPVTATKKVRFYSPTFYMNINWDSNHNSNPSTLQEESNYSVFEWTDVELTAGEPIVFLYQGLSASDAWTSTIRSNTYWSGDISNRGGSSGVNGQFAINESGIYSVKLDLSKVAPAVTFTKTGDIVAKESVTVTVSIINSGRQWKNTGSTDAAKVKANLIKDATETFQSDADTRTITITVTGDDFATKGWPNIQFYVMAGTKGTYYGDDATGVKLSGTKYSATKSTSKWSQDANTKGCHMWYEGTLTSENSFTFVFTFDATGALTAVAIS